MWHLAPGGVWPAAASEHGAGAASELSVDTQPGPCSISSQALQGPESPGHVGASEWVERRPGPVSVLGRSQAQPPALAGLWTSVRA